MTLSAEDADFRAKRPTRRPATGPKVVERDWGYAISDGDSSTRLLSLGAATGRFVGAILLMAAFGLWILPDATFGADIFAIKVALAVMFSVFGAYFVWAGRHSEHPEFQIDLTRREIRIGQRGTGDGFRMIGRIEFTDVSSVFVLRSKDHTARPRLYLRLADLETGIEIAAGSASQLDVLKIRLTRDLSGQKTRTVEKQLNRHQIAAA